MAGTPAAPPLPAPWLESQRRSSREGACGRRRERREDGTQSSVKNDGERQTDVHLETRVHPFMLRLGWTTNQHGQRHWF